MRYVLTLFVFLLALPAMAGVHAVIIRGAGGEAEFDGRFTDWTGRLNRALAQRLYLPEENISVVGAESSATLDGIHDVFAELPGQVTAEDTLAVFLIGHGSYQRDDAKLNLDGPDLTAQELGTLLDGVGAGTNVIINSASTSAAFINRLSGPNRIICSATKSVEERNATEFMEYIVQSLEDGSADADRDGRISAFELCQQAAGLTEAWYTAQGFIASEHALLDDNGDGLGTRLVLDESAEPKPAKREDAPKELDGAAAKQVYLTETLFQGAPPELVAAYEAAMSDVEALIARKGEMDSQAYYAELERLFIAAAHAQRTVREAVASQAPVEGDS